MDQDLEMKEGRPDMWTHLRLAFSFLTILPVGRIEEEITPEKLQRSAAFFPLVGWLIGLFLVCLAWISGWAGATPMISGVLLVIFDAFLTRGLHLDGVADFLDGLGGADREQRLSIMKDSTVGVFGVVGLVLSLFLKIFCTAAILENVLFPLPIIIVPAAARWAMVLLAFAGRYPREAGTGHAFVGQIRKQDLAVGGLVLLPAFFFGLHGIVTVAAALLPALWLHKKAKQALGGVTGDVLGASCVFGEAAGLLAASLMIL